MKQKGSAAPRGGAAVQAKGDIAADVTTTHHGSADVLHQDPHIFVAEIITIAYQGPQNNGAWNQERRRPIEMVAEEVMGDAKRTTPSGGHPSLPRRIHRLQALRQR
jgi:hypothetical protein